MKLAYFDCFSGISGDMLLGALVECGADLAAIEREVARLGLHGLQWRQEQVKRGLLMATQVTVAAPEQHHHRGYSDIVALIRKARLSPRVEKDAVAIFGRLGEAEAALHGWPLEQVHFHEVGAIDSIADIVGACVGMELLGIAEIRCSALNVGSGTVKCDHGVLPVPAPATLALLKGIPVYSTGTDAELVTPTGAAIVSALAKNFGPIPAMTIGAVGYGAGSSDRPELPNVLRVTIGESDGATAVLEPLWMLEANVDDMNPQVSAYFAERAFASGALDVFFTPVQMKKGRAGLLFSVLCRSEHRTALMDLFFQETTTLGVRSYEVLRQSLEREFVLVATRYGEVRIKVARRNGQILNVSPEYEDCRRLAEDHAVPLRAVMQEATFSYWNQAGADAQAENGTGPRSALERPAPFHEEQKRV